MEFPNASRLLITAGLSLGLAACGPTVRQEAHSAVISGICAPGQRPPQLEANDCDRLPALPKTMEAGTEYTSKLMGAVLLGDRLTIEDKGIPSAYIQATTEALQNDAYVAYSTRGLRGIFFYSNNGADGHDGAAFQDKSDSINFRLNVIGDEDLRSFDTNGSIRSVLIHEGTHNRMAHWLRVANNDSSPETAADLVALNKEYQLDIQDVAETFRIARGQEMIALLEQYLRANTNKADFTQAIRLLQEQFTRTRGLESLAVTPVTSLGHSVRRDIQGYIEYLAKASGRPLPEMPSRGKELLKEAERLYEESLRTYYTGLTEGTLLAGLRRQGGHPFDNLDELVASYIACSQLNSAGMLTAIRAFPQERQDRIARQLRLINSLYKRNDPEVVKHLQLPWLLSQL